MTRLNPPRPMILIDSKSFIEMSRFYVKLVPGCGFILAKWASKTVLSLRTDRFLKMNIVLRSKAIKNTD